MAAINLSVVEMSFDNIKRICKMLDEHEGWTSKTRMCDLPKAENPDYVIERSVFEIREKQAYLIRDVYLTNIKIHFNYDG